MSKDTQSMLSLYKHLTCQYKMRTYYFKPMNSQELNSHSPHHLWIYPICRLAHESMPLYGQCIHTVKTTNVMAGHNQGNQCHGWAQPWQRNPWSRTTNATKSMAMHPNPWPSTATATKTVFLFY